MTRDEAFSFLRKEANAPAGPGVLKTIGAATKGFFGSGGHVADVMASQGVKSPVLLGAAKATPYVAAAYGAKKAYDSPTAQNLRYRYQMWKQERAARKAMEQGGYYNG